MSAFLETLKSRMAESLKRFQDTHARLQALTQENLAASQEYESWKKAVEAETKREQALTTAEGTPLLSATVDATPATHGAAIQVEPQVVETSKTDMIRDLLRQHPAGMSPVEVWKSLQQQIPQRSYIYAVLGRLKHREEVGVKRGKYCLRVSPKPEEAKQQQTIQ